MPWSITLGSVRGIPIKFHLTFVLILIWGAYQYGGNNGVSGMIYGAGLTLLLFGIVLLHELGHSLAALYFGIPVKDITLLPIGGVARLERMPEKPAQELVVAAAGPAVNVALIFVFTPLLFLVRDDLFGGSLMRSMLAGPSLAGTLVFLSIVNLSLLIFNLIPAFPLDGGRIFRSILAMFVGTPRATRVAVRVGQGFAIILAVIGIIPPFNIFTILVALFIFSAGGAEGRAVAVRTVLDGATAREALPANDTVLQPNFTMMEVASMTLHSRQNFFPVMFGDALIGILRRQDVRHALEMGRNWASVAEVMQRDFLKMPIDTPLSEIQSQLLQSELHVAAVYEQAQFQGLIGFEDLERAFYMLSNQKPARNPA